MAGDFDALSLAEMTELLVATFSNLLPDRTIARNSDNWKRLRMVAGAVVDLHAHIDVAARDAMPDTAGEAMIGRFGEIYGLPRKGANGASGINAGRIRGDEGSTWTTADALRHRSGLRFRPAVGGELDSSGEALVSIVALDTGPTTRLSAGEVLTWEATAPDGMENEVALVADLDQGGEERERIGEYRSRLLRRIAQPAMGGNANDWRTWALESSAEIKTAHVYPTRNGLGSVDVAALKGGRGTARLLSDDERAALQAYLNARRPVTSTSRVLEVLAEEVDVEITLLPEVGGQFARDWNDRDWDDTTPLTLTSAGWVEPNLVLTGPRPASMAVGDRVIVRGTAGIEMEVAALPADPTRVTIRDTHGQTPPNNAAVYSGGPLIAPVRAAVLALFDSLGPRIGEYGVGDWDDTLRLARLFETAQTAPGVLDSKIVTPSVSVEPTPESDPYGERVNVLIPGAVLVRYA